MAKNNGTLITGEHVIDDEPNITKVSMGEWDFYLDVLYPNNSSAGLLAYTPEITYAIVKSYDATEVQEFKSKLYGVNFRPKLTTTFLKDEEQKYIKLRNSFPRPKYMCVLGEKDKFLLMMEKWNK